MQRLWPWIVLAFALGTASGALGVVGLSPSSTGAPPPPVAPEQVQPAPVEPPGPSVTLAAAAMEPAAAAEGPIADRFLARLEQVSAGWGRMQEELTQLRRRVVELEQRLAAVQSAPSPAAAGSVAQPRLGATPDGQRRALVKAGLSEDDAATLVQRQGQRSLERLELRDIAQREGWLGTARYREELARLDEGAISLREELGDVAYDRYLYATGEDNRVRVDGIIPGSVADLAGLQPGDLIESYAGQSLFSYSDLRDATAGGDRGELVRVQVRRGGRTLDINLSRGPLGVQLDTTSAEPLQAP